MPWHRVRYVKAGDLTVWDRHARVDLVFGTGDTPAADLTAIGRPRAAAPAKAAARAVRRQSRSTPPECLRFDPAAGAWVPAGPPGDVQADAVQVATFNVLSDAYDRDLTYPDLRVPACVELLEGLGADVVALHEVTPALWDALLAAAWVRDGYCVSPGPTRIGYGTSCWPAGRSPRGPPALHLQTARPGRLRPQRAAGRVRRRAPHQRPHRRRRAAPGTPAAHHRRAARPRRPRRRRRPGRPQLRRRHPRPTWTATPTRGGLLHPHDAGFTFDPAVNPLAALASVTGRPRRLDRILVRSGTPGGLVPLAVERFADRPFDGDRFVSDHFGVTALLQDRPVPPAASHGRRRCTRRRWCCGRRRRRGRRCRRSARRTTRRSGAGCRT